ncbi:adenosylcobinamide-phosphate synthase CbiB [Cognatishimia sp. F0-27]|uniref:adenosylcobinamide-phosphate synthase CbiB n=1 Tax=Cognatishimia sp. F0-27 TaxID=2816855 RepID=UPI001D0C58D5|nr:adenosylcobinamide-phosphate synthase CbiB [Cognatishimia sp. F0-27]MCC1493284.1 cobalamin biosynthesis protein CobD [Cognatishimia sp. F0-27]
MNFALVMLGAACLDGVIGWPSRLYARIGHPVTWIGALIAGLERRWNHGSRRARLIGGAATTLVVLATALLPLWAIQSVLPSTWTGHVLAIILAWPLIAVRAMHDHVAAVAKPLMAGDLPAARHAVSMIVGRDPARLDDAGVARAAIESLAENTSDGIIAPLFWGVVAGLPGLAGYKAINTLDSMIGHRSDRYEAFGKAAARLDDLANWLPARLTGLLFALASGRRMRHAVTVMRRDAPRHRSPNAGWPEGAMAAGLGIRLSGPRLYGDTIANEPWLHGEAPDPKPRDIDRALALYRRTMAICALALAALALF